MPGWVFLAKPMWTVALCFSMPDTFLTQNHQHQRIKGNVDITLL